MLWLCQTPLDIIVDVALQQQEIGKAIIATFRDVNSIASRAQKYAWSCGIPFPPLSLPFRFVAVCDSSHALKSTTYALEGVLILVMRVRR